MSEREDVGEERGVVVGDGDGETWCISSLGSFNSWNDDDDDLVGGGGAAGGEFLFLFLKEGFVIGWLSMVGPATFARMLP